MVGFKLDYIDLILSKWIM